MKPFIPLTLILTAALSSMAPLANADTLLIDVISQSPVNSNEGLPRPERGQNMGQVRAQFGSPIDERPSVGEPPISRWIYGKFTVYFEYQHVIKSVVHRKP